MQRRPRIKAVANLSASRRAANKNNPDSQTKTSNESEKSNEYAKIEHNTSVIELTATQECEQQCDSSQESSKLGSVVNEKLLEPLAQSETELKISQQIETKTPSQDDPSTFKTPPQMPRNEKEPTGTSTSHSNANKFRKFKIAPRLTAPRNVTKSQVSEFQINLRTRNVHNVKYFRKKKSRLKFLLK